MRRLATLAASALLLVLGATDLHAQLNHREIITELMKQIAGPPSERGFVVDQSVLTRGRMVGMLTKGVPVGVELDLVKGTYYISGVCDYDCSDMDLRLQSPDGGTTIAEDLDDDDSPILMFDIKESGAYLLLIMVTESKAPSYFGVQVFKKN
jgi:hypothetical protein